MGVAREIAVCAVRLSMGRTTTAAEVETVVAAMGDCVGAARAVAAR
jgi:cysteine sulfinate desulfinase/cysteine desulfurase-like protein